MQAKMLHVFSLTSATLLKQLTISFGPFVWCAAANGSLYSRYVFNSLVQDQSDVLGFEVSLLICYITYIAPMCVCVPFPVHVQYLFCFGYGRMCNVLALAYIIWSRTTERS